MNKKINNVVTSAKNFWDRQKGTIAVAATCTTVLLVAANVSNVKATDKFLKEHDLFDEFYNINTLEVIEEEN